jgi:hypothetical protein
MHVKKKSIVGDDKQKLNTIFFLIKVFVFEILGRIL